MFSWNRNRVDPSTRYQLRERMVRETEAYLTYQLRAASETRLARQRRERWSQDRFRSNA